MTPSLQKLIDEVEAVIIKNKSLTVANKQLQELVEKEEAENEVLLNRVKRLVAEKGN